jgi:hypothetical protein
MALTESHIRIATLLLAQLRIHKIQASCDKHQMRHRHMQVRANSLQELVYKQGQAGITKASVSIVFNNQDKQNSPVGYEHFDQLTVTRQVKYVLSPHKAAHRGSAPLHLKSRHGTMRLSGGETDE